jgi:hypothetical protein
MVGYDTGDGGPGGEQVPAGRVEGIHIRCAPALYVCMCVRVT